MKNAVENNITVSGNPYDLTDDEAESLLRQELRLFAKGMSSLLGETKKEKKA